MGVGFNKGTDGRVKWQHVAVWPVYVSHNPSQLSRRHVAHVHSVCIVCLSLTLFAIKHFFFFSDSVNQICRTSAWVENKKKKAFYKTQPQADSLQVWSSQIESALLKHFLFLDMILDPTLGFVSVCVCVCVWRGVIAITSNYNQTSVCFNLPSCSLEHIMWVFDVLISIKLSFVTRLFHAKRLVFSW